MGTRSSKVKEESEKVGLKLNIQKTKVMASGPITSWQLDGETVETVADFILGGSKIIADDDCSHEIKRHLLLGRKVMTKLDSILKSRDITLPTKVCLVKAMVSPVVMYGCESWTTKKSEHRRIDAFELWCWRRLLRGPWTRRSNQSILKEIGPEYSLEGLMLKLKLQYLGHLMRRTDSLEKTLMLGKIEGRRRRGWERMRWLDGIQPSNWLNGHEIEQAPGVGDGQAGLVCCSPWGRKKSDTTERLNWTGGVSQGFVWNARCLQNSHLPHPSTGVVGFPQAPLSSFLLAESCSFPPRWGRLTALTRLNSEMLLLSFSWHSTRPLIRESPGTSFLLSSCLWLSFAYLLLWCVPWYPQDQSPYSASLDPEGVTG